MHSIDDLLNMIATESFDGGSRDHFFDERYIRDEPIAISRAYGRPASNEPILDYRLEVIIGPDGLSYWKE